MSAIRLIVGLGNPGPEYEHTRHNAGAWFAEQLVRIEQVSLQLEKKFHARIVKLPTHADSTILIPTMYMNQSGRAVAAFAHFYKIAPQEMLIAHDELDFDPGVARLKEGGGHGGHNGLRDIIRCLGSSDFVRLRIGIGHPGNKNDVVNYVLCKPSCSDRDAIHRSIEEAISAVPDMLSGDLQGAFRKLHQ